MTTTTPAATGHIEPTPERLSMADLLDAYEAALLRGQLGIARQVRRFIDGRHHTVETFSFGSSLVREALHGRRGPSPVGYRELAPCWRAQRGNAHEMHWWRGQVETWEAVRDLLCLGAH
jgi:hypothetical protein